MHYSFDISTRGGYVAGMRQQEPPPNLSRLPGINPFPVGRNARIWPLTLCFATLMSVSAQPKITVDSPLAWVAITPSTDHHFSSKVKSLIGAEAASAISDVLPLSVLVANTGSQPLVGIDVRFSFGSGPTPIVRNFFYHSFPEPTRPVLPPGRTLLFTPFRDANAIAARSIAVRGGQGGQGGAVRHDTKWSGTELFRLLMAADTLRISVDLAVSADGRVAGQDLAMTLRDLAEERDAYAKTRLELLRFFAEGRSNDSIQSWLSSLANRRLVRDPVTRRTDNFVATQASLASEWSAKIGSGGQVALREQLLLQTPESIYSIVNSLRGGLK
jgi:hypothetical protein